MDQYINLETGHYPCSLEDIRRYLNRISLPKEPSKEQLLKYGFSWVHPVSKPKRGEVVERYPRYVDGTFYQVWDIVEPTDLPNYRHQRLQVLEDTYHATLKKGWLHQDQRLDITDNDELQFIFLECLYLSDYPDQGDSKKTIAFPTTSGNWIDYEISDALLLIRELVAYKRRLKQSYLKKRQSIQTAKTIAACRQVSTEGVIEC